MGNTQAHDPPNIKKDVEEPVDLTKLPEIIEAILSGDPKQEFTGCQLARKLAGVGDLPPLDSIVQSGILPKCIELLKSSNHETQSEVAWMISNIAGHAHLLKQTKHVKVLVELGVMDPLVQLLRATHPEVLLHTIGALCNITAHVETRYLPIRAGALPQLISIAMSPTSQVSVRKYVTMTFMNLCSGNVQPPPRRALNRIFSTLVHLINDTDTGVTTHACHGLANLMMCSTEWIEQILDTGVTSQLIQLLTTADLQPKLIVPCLRVIENLLEGTDEQKDRILAAGSLIQELGHIVELPDMKNAEVAASLISKIADGSPNEVNAVIDGGLIPVLIKVIKSCMNEAEAKNAKNCKKVVTHATLALRNISDAREEDQIELMYNNGIIPAICAVLKLEGCDNALKNALRTLEDILETVDHDEEKAREYREAVEEAGGIDTLEQLQVDRDQNLDEDDNDRVYHIATRIMDHFFEEDEPLEGEVKPPKVPRVN